MAGMAISMLATVAMLGMLALNAGMLIQRWQRFLEALAGRPLAQALPMTPPAETNVVMLRPMRRSLLNRPVPASRHCLPIAA